MIEREKNYIIHDDDLCSVFPLWRNLPAIWNEKFANKPSEMELDFTWKNKS